MSKHMRHLVRTMVVAVVLLMALPASAALPPRPPSGNGIDLIGHSTPADLSGYVMSIMQPWDFAKQVQATNQGSIPRPCAKDLTSTRATDCGTNAGGGTLCIQNGVICPPGVNDAPNYAGGLGFCWTYRNHPAWFLHHDGQLVKHVGWPTSYQIDWRRTAYQRAWADHVIADAQAHGWRWVWAEQRADEPALLHDVRHLRRREANAGRDQGDAGCRRSAVAARWYPHHRQPRVDRSVPDALERLAAVGGWLRERARDGRGGEQQGSVPPQAQSLHLREVGGHRSILHRGSPYSLSKCRPTRCRTTRTRRLQRRPLGTRGRQRSSNATVARGTPPVARAVRG